MRLVVVLALAGCGFEHGALGTVGPSDDADILPDTPPPIAIDAAVDAKPDAPPPCPDEDADGVCNAVDDWPCGAKPTSPPATVQFMNNSGATVTTITVINLDGTGRMAVASPSTNVSLTFRLQITDTACNSNCVDQIEAGWVDHAANTGNRFNTCLFDNGVSKSNGLDTNLSFNVGGPATRKVYDLRVNLGQNYSCGANGVNGWWGGQVPPDTRTIARLCVD
jgi:hypothetical protein